MSHTNTILKLQKQTLPNKILNKVSSFIASLFSIIFSMSIIREATHFIQEWYIIVLLIVFIILFLIFNEYRKVIELRLRFANCKSSLFIIIITFIISFSLSGVGIFLWTNKTLENEVKNDEIIVSERLSIEKRYNALIDSVNTLKIEENAEYIRLTNEVNYWKGRSAANLEERTYLREQIEGAQNKVSNFSNYFRTSTTSQINRYNHQKDAEINSISVNFNNKKKFISRANKISFIFFLMVIVTELIIILLAREYASQKQEEIEFSEGDIQSNFLDQYRAITEILMRKDEIEFNDIVFSPYFKFSKNPEKRAKEVKNVFYLLGSLNITKSSLEEAQTKLKDYYETLLNI